MSIENKIKKEIESFTCQMNKRIATIGTTARTSQSFAVLPRRQALGFQAINFLIEDPESAKTCMKYLDGKVRYLLIDIELKKNIDLMTLAKTHIHQSKIHTYKPNDTTLEAADMFLRNYFEDQLKDKKILIYGAGNLGTKLALRLAERGSKVYLDSRNQSKTIEIVRVLNYLLPRQSKNFIKSVQDPHELSSKMDVFIAFTSASNVIPASSLHFMKKNGLAIDGGIDNFTPEFIQKAADYNLQCYRLDVRTAFPHTVLYLNEHTKNFYQHIQGEIFVDHIRIVAGGIIGFEGDIVVDNISQPKQLVGVANGTGGLKLLDEYTSSDHTNVRYVQEKIIIE
ncbi:hypothetical protein QUF49_10525 [Fictibacillus sp. b24]|uniref:hypothetical protein n=1 Tax=Fictibacillus sp. b24 TaxID=3055863 RepID=UPI0025A300C6|nr:hypothetical protein [Fictibacillus sp. b24]MDM5316427.1 hypothetical protein [Fictibacillus sp. b24]